MQFEGQTEVCAYTYPSEGQLPLLWEGIAEVASASVNGLTGTSRATGILSDAGLNGPSAKPELSAEEARCSFEAGREVGLREGRLAEKEAHAEARTAADG